MVNYGKINNDKKEGNMNEILSDIREKLAKNYFQNEEHVRISLVLRILFELGWDIWNPKEVNSEFKAVPNEDVSRVDIALFSNEYLPPSIFIEIKSVGKVNTDLFRIEQQLRDYNRNNTAQFSIITDGQKWRFYYSQTGGEFSQKCFKVIDIIQNDLSDVINSLTLFLSKDEILSGNSKKEAERLLKLNQKQRALEDALPRAKRMISEYPFPSLPQALVEIVSKLGFTMSEEEAKEFAQKSTQKIIKENFSTKVIINPQTKNNYYEKDTTVRNNNKKDYKKIKIEDLINAGIIKPSIVIYNTYKGMKFEARILENGEIKVGNNKTTIFKSPSTAASYITGNNINGWVWWKCRDEKGREIPLDAFREKLKKKPDFEDKQERSNSYDNHERKGYQDERRNITKEFLKANDTNKREIMSFTHLDEASIGEGEKASKIPRDDSVLSWLSLRRMAARSAIRAGKRNELLTMAGYEDLNSNKNWRISNDLGLKIHQYGAGETCKSVLIVAEMLKSKIDIKFHWQDNKEAKYPGEKGLISYNFSKEVSVSV